MTTIKEKRENVQGPSPVSFQHLDVREKMHQRENEEWDKRNPRERVTVRQNGKMCLEKQVYQMPDTSIRMRTKNSIISVQLW